MAMGIGPMSARKKILSNSTWNGNFREKSYTLLIVETRNCVPMSFSSNGTFSLVARREGEVMVSNLTGCVCNLPIRKKKVETQNYGLLSRHNVFNQNLWFSLPLAHSLFKSVHRL